MRYLFIFTLLWMANTFSARNQGSIYVEEVEKTLEESKQALAVMKKQLKEAQSTLDEWKEKANQVSDAKKYYDMLPAKYRPASKESAEKIFDAAKKGAESFEQGKKWLAGKIKEIEKLEKINEKATSYVKKLRKWDPENSNNNPYYGLEMISGILADGASKFPPPLNKFVSGYADAAKALVGSLKKVQKKIEERGQGSVCVNRATAEKRALAKYISTTQYECSSCRIGDYWPLFAKYSLVSCEQGGAGGGYILYDGSGTKDVFHEIPNRNVADIVYSWMSAADFPKYRQSIKFLKTYINAYERDKKSLLADMKVLSNWKALEKYHECTGKELYNTAIDLAQSDNFNDFLKYAITDRSKYQADKTRAFAVLKKKIAISGFVENKGKKKGIRVRARKSEKGSILKSVSTKAGGRYCLVMGRKSAGAKVFLQAKSGKRTGEGLVEVDPNLFSYGKYLRLREEKEEAEDELSEILAQTENAEEETKEPEEEKGKGEPGEDKGEFGSDVAGKGDEKGREEKGEKDKKADETGGTSGLAGLNEFCSNAIQDARTARDEFIAARDRFRNSFESENANASCSSKTAGYYYVEMRRAALKMRSILRSLQSELGKLDKPKETGDSQIDWCISKLKRGGEILARVQAYRKNIYQRYRNNNCNVADIIRQGERLEPGLMPSEIETQITSDAGMWLASSSDPAFAQVAFAPMCLSSEIMSQQAEAMAQALAQATLGKLPTSPVVRTTVAKNRIVTEITMNVGDADCTGTITAKFDTTLGETTGTQVISFTSSVSGKDCDGKSSSTVYTLSLSKVSDQCQ